MAKPENVRCPDCDGQMVSRANRSTGQRFWGCAKFPSCKGTRDTSGFSKAEREQEHGSANYEHKTSTTGEGW